MKRSLFMLGLWLGCSIFCMDVTAQALDAEAPAFASQTLTGEAITLADYRGQVVILDFWASWCGPCREEMPFLIDLYDEFKDQALTIIGINIDTDLANMQAFLDELATEVPFVMVNDANGALPALYDLEGMPTTVFLDREGVIRYRHTGFRKKDEPKYRDEIEALLAEAK